MLPKDVVLVAFLTDFRQFEDKGLDDETPHILVLDGNTLRADFEVK